MKALATELHDPIPAIRLKDSQTEIDNTLYKRQLSMDEFYQLRQFLKGEDDRETLDLDSDNSL